MSTGTRTSESDPLRVDFVRSAIAGTRGRIGMTFAPGKRAAGIDGRWERELRADLDRLYDVYATAVLVSLLEPAELRLLGIQDLHERARDRGLRVLVFAIPDGGVPASMDDTVALVAQIVDAAAELYNVVIHCRGGLGRTGLVAACCVVALGHSPDEAMRAVRASRQGAIESASQERFVERFAIAWAASPHAAVARGASVGSSMLCEAIRGCLLGGALGDALGYPIEFDRSIDSIVGRHGSRAPRQLAYAGAPPARISDDTQMTLFVAEGLIRASQRASDRGLAHGPTMIRHALMRWYLTQDPRSGALVHSSPGWLVGERRLQERRAPGTTNLSALRAQVLGGAMPDLDHPPNDSKGCGAVMRSAPIGLAAPSREDAFALGRDAAVLTHGHPSGYLAAAYFAALVHDLSRGMSLPGAMPAADVLLRAERGHEEVAAAIAAARAVAERGIPDARALESLGGGWVAEQALAIALACALTVEEDSSGAFAAALWRSAVHGGDSDSTASLTGNLIGCTLSATSLPESWLAELELRDVVERVADDLCGSAILDAELDYESYPPN